MTSNAQKPHARAVNNSSDNLLQGPKLLSETGLEIEGKLKLGNCRNHVFPVLSGTAEIKTANIGGIRKPQPLLRLVTNRETLSDVPRRYPQSTSGRMSSTNTTPELSRSSAIAVDSAIRSFVDSAFRRYPTEVSQRRAYSSCASRGSELRYDRRDSIGGVLPSSNVLAIPFVHLPARRAPYDGGMDIRDVRRRRLRELKDELGSQQAIADRLQGEQNYISGLLSGKKPFGEKTARKIEKACGKPEKWLDQLETSEERRVSEWPFSLDPEFWRRLNPQQRHEIEGAFTKMVLGANIEQAAAKPPKKRSA